MKHEIYKAEDLELILETMASYIAPLSNEEKTNYLIELADTGLFHDAIGKVIEKNESIITINEY